MADLAGAGRDLVGEGAGRPDLELPRSDLDGGEDGGGGQVARRDWRRVAADMSDTRGGRVRRCEKVGSRVSSAKMDGEGIFIGRGSNESPNEVRFSATRS